MLALLQDLWPQEVTLQQQQEEEEAVEEQEQEQKQEQHEGKREQLTDLLQVVVVLQLEHELVLQVTADLLWSALRARQVMSLQTLQMGGNADTKWETHEGQRSLVNVAAGPRVPVDLRWRPGDDATAAAALPPRRFEGGHFPLNQRHGTAGVCGLDTQAQVQAACQRQHADQEAVQRLTQGGMSTPSSWTTLLSRCCRSGETPTWNASSWTQNTG